MIDMSMMGQWRQILASYDRCPYFQITEYYLQIVAFPTFPRPFRFDLALRIFRPLQADSSVAAMAGLNQSWCLKIIGVPFLGWRHKALVAADDALSLLRRTSVSWRDLEDPEHVPVRVLELPTVCIRLSCSNKAICCCCLERELVGGW